LFVNIRDKKPLIFYCEMKLEWREEEHTVWGGGERERERERLEWFKIGIWKLSGMRGRYDKGRCPFMRI
jgi:hypothetical protein